MEESGKSRNCFNFTLANKYGRGGWRGLCAFQRFTLYIAASKKDKLQTEVFPFQQLFLKGVSSGIWGFHIMSPLYLRYLKKNSVIAAATGVEEHRKGHFGFYHRVTLEHIFHYRLSSSQQAVIGQVASMASLSYSMKAYLGCRWFTSVILSLGSLISHYGESHAGNTKMYFKIHISKLMQMLVV